jgi:hypothetical protein
VETEIASSRLNLKDGTNWGASCADEVHHDGQVHFVWRLETANTEDPRVLVAQILEDKVPALILCVLFR